MKEYSPLVIALLTVGSVFEFILLVRFAVWCDDFKYERQYLKMEIKRSEGKAKRYYRRRLLRLWLSIIPFVRYK